MAIALREHRSHKAFMELGFARFLEMFEERFGRLVTTLLLGMLA